MITEPDSLLATLPPVIERYELKYLIPYAMIEPITAFVEPYCAYDQHSAATADSFYAVNSLYFDTPSYRFLNQRRWGADQRFNMRVRAYDDGRSGPYFAEIKYKTATSVKKFRAHVQASEWPGFLTGAASDTAVDETDDRESISRKLFLRLAESYAIEPKIFTCYRRRALFSRVDDYARVTFDVNMRFRQQDPMHAADQYSLSPDSDCLNYDAQTIFGDEVAYNANVVLELKASIGAVPVWMIDLIRRFELKQVGFSKYLNSTLAEHLDNGWHYMPADRIAGVAA